MELNAQEAVTQPLETVDPSAPSQAAPQAAQDAPNPFEAVETEQAQNKPASVPMSRFNEVYAASKESARQLQAVEAEKHQLSEALDFVHKIYGEYEMPIETMRHDAQFMEYVDKFADDPAIAPAIAKVKALMKGQQPLPTVKPAPPKTQEDDRVLRILQRDVRSRTEGMLAKSQVHEALKPDFVEYVLANADFSKDVEDANILDLLKQFYSKKSQNGSDLLNKQTPRTPTQTARKAIQADDTTQPGNRKITSSKDWSDKQRERARQFMEQGGSD